MTSGSLFSQVISMSLVEKVLTLSVMIRVLGSMDEWTHALSRWRL